MGTIMDMTGKMAEPTTMGVLPASKALYSWVNDTNYIPGIRIEVASEDDRYDRAQIVTCYKRLQAKGPIAIQVYTGDNAEVLKPLAGRDKIPVVTYGAGTLAIDPPGYTFVTVCMYDCQVIAILNWIKDNWDVGKMGRPAKYVHAGWDNAMGSTGVLPGQLYCAQLPTVDFASAEIVPPGTMDMSSNAIRMKALDPDYVWMALIAPPAASLLKTAKAQGMDLSPFLWGDYSVFMFNTVERILGEEGVDLSLHSTSYFHKSMDTPGLKRMFELWDKYVKKDYWPTIGMEVGYNPAQTIVEGIKRAAAKVGPENVTSEDVYQALQTIKNWETGTMLPLTFGPDRRDGCRLAMFYQRQNGEFVPIYGGKAYDGGNPHPVDLIAAAK